jgi:hypothetical protein
VADFSFGKKLTQKNLKWHYKLLLRRIRFRSLSMNIIGTP